MNLKTIRERKLIKVSNTQTEQKRNHGQEKSGRHLDRN
jgi:hypothetical protein